jgi:hypothetical protein
MPIKVPRSRPGRSARLTVLKADHAVGTYSQIRIDFRRYELGVLRLKIGFGNPTGPTAAASNMNRHVVFDRVCQQLLARERSTDAIARAVAECQMWIVGSADIEFLRSLETAAKEVSLARSSAAAALPQLGSK